MPSVKALREAASREYRIAEDIRREGGSYAEEKHHMDAAAKLVNRADRQERLE